MPFPADPRRTLTIAALAALFFLPHAGPAQAAAPHDANESGSALQACLAAARAASPHPDHLAWRGAKARRIAEDAYRVTAEIDVAAPDGTTRGGTLQCDVIKAPGDRFVVSKVTMPK